MDTRLLGSRYRVPTTYRVVEKVVQLIRNNHGKKICIFFKDNSMDNVLLEIQQKLKEAVCVNAQKMDMLRNINLQAGFVTNPEKSRIYALDLDSDMNPKLVKEEADVCILLSTTMLSRVMREKLRRQGVHVYCYRSHSLSEELKLLLNKLQPEIWCAFSEANSKTEDILQSFLNKNNWHEKNDKIEFWKNIDNLDELFKSRVFNKDLVQNKEASLENITQLTSISANCDKHFCGSSGVNVKWNEVCQETESNNPQLNLKCVVTVCNIFESVNFFEMIGLKPTWKNKLFYNSPEKVKKLGHFTRRKK